MFDPLKAHCNPVPPMEAVPVNVNGEPVHGMVVAMESWRSPATKMALAGELNEHPERVLMMVT
jgi:hypothetical protein